LFGEFRKFPHQVFKLAVKRRREDMLGLALHAAALAAVPTFDVHTSGDAYAVTVDGSAWLASAGRPKLYVGHKWASLSLHK